MTLNEMQGLLAGKCLPSDIKANETLAEYFLRKMNHASALVAENVLLTSVDTWLSHQQAGVAALVDADNAGHTEDEVIKAGLIAVIQSIRTPATDAIKVEIKAQGVEEFANDCDNQVGFVEPEDDEHFSLMTEQARQFAAALRGGLRHDY